LNHFLKHLILLLIFIVLYQLPNDLVWNDLLSELTRKDKWFQVCEELLFKLVVYKDLVNVGEEVWDSIDV
jgi:hypothetical protein